MLDEDMRILSIITSFTAGGAEALVTNLSRRFVAEGHQTLVAALCDAESLNNSPASELAMQRRLTQAGAGETTLHLANRRNPISGAMALRRLIAGFAPDVIHAHTAQAAVYLALLRPSVPVVMTHHNIRLNFPAALFRLLDTVVSEYVGISGECTVLLSGLSRRPVTTIINAADPACRAPAPRPAPGHTPVIISVGAPSTQKDYVTLLRAAPLLRRSLATAGRRCAIRIVGVGPRIPLLRRIIDDLGIGDMASLLGARDDVPALLEEADLYVNTSQWEGLPLAIIEALMAGLPVVATDIAGNRELVRGGVSGQLIPAENPAATAAAIASVLLDTPRYAALSRGAWEAGGRYSIDGAARQHLALYARVGAGRAAARAA
jgi:glycosyltransferase involved in cell wall biosynthesis